MFSPGIEPGTFCVLDRCDNHYTTKTSYRQWPANRKLIQFAIFLQILSLELPKNEDDAISSQIS